MRPVNRVPSSASLPKPCRFLAFTLLTLACAPAAPPPDPEPDAGVNVTVTVTVTLRGAAERVVAGEALQFEAAVSGAADPTVVWSVNGIPGGDATVGTLDAAGLYLAPAAVPVPAAVTVRAASLADPSAFAEAPVTVVEPAVAGLLARYSNGALRLEGPIAHGANDACTTTGGHEYEGRCRPAADAPVDWAATSSFSVEWTGFLLVPRSGEYYFESDGALKGAARVEIDGVVLAEQTAQDTPWAGTLSLAAGQVPVKLSFASTDSPNRVRFGWKNSSGVVVPVPRAHLAPRVGISADVAGATVAAGASQAFTATVLGSLDPSVTWSVEAGTCGAEKGSVTSAGVFTAGSPTADCEVTVVATSASDPTQSVRIVVAVSGTRPPAPTPLATHPGGLGQRRLVVDAAGNALALWVAYVLPEPSQLLAARYDAASRTWGATFSLHVDPGNLGVDDLAAAGNAAGNVVVLWSQRYQVGGTTHPEEVWARGYDLSTDTWSPVKILDASHEVPGMLAVDVGTNGDAIAAWYRDPTYQPRRMYGAAFDASTGTWSTTARLDADDPNAILGTASGSFSEWSGVVMDGSGNGTVVWQHSTGSEWVLMANRHVGSTKTWDGERAINSLSPAYLGGETLVPLAGGATLALWADASSAPPSRIYAASSDPVTGAWSTPQIVSQRPEWMTSHSLRAAGDGAGNVVVVWQQDPTDGGYDQAWTMTRTAAGVWSTPFPLDGATSGGSQPAVDMNSAGTAVVGWAQRPPGVTKLQPYAARYQAATGSWSSTRLVSELLTSSAGGTLRVGVDGAGVGRLLWSQHPTLLTACLP